VDQEKRNPSSPPIVVQIADLIGATLPLLLSSEKNQEERKNQPEEGERKKRSKNRESEQARGLQ